MVPMIPNVSPIDQQQQSSITLVPADIVAPDGSVETVYIQQMPCKPSGTQHIHKHLTTGYLAVGIIALLIGIAATLYQINKNQ